MIWFRKHITQEARVTHEAHTIQHRAQRIAMLKSTWTTVKWIFTLTINKKSTEQTKHNDTAHTYDTLVHFLPYNKPLMSITKYSLQFQPAEFLAEMQKQPQLVICSVEFLASREVHSYKLYQFHPAQCRNMVTGERYSSRLCPLLTWDSTHHLHRWMPGLKDIQIREPRMWKPLGFVPYCILKKVLSGLRRGLWLVRIPGRL